MLTLKKSLTVKSVRSLMTAVAILALGTGLSSSAFAQNEKSESFENGMKEASPIEGTWILTIDRISQGFSFSALQSFTAGGVVLATGTVDRLPPPPISPLYGSWRRTGRNSYSVAISFFAFDPAGNAVAMIKTSETFQIGKKDNLIGAGDAVACDVHGDNCVNANLPITITGKRLIAE